MIEDRCIDKSGSKEQDKSIPGTAIHAFLPSSRLIPLLPLKNVRAESSGNSYQSSSSSSESVSPPLVVAKVKFTPPFAAS